VDRVALGIEANMAETAAVSLAKARSPPETIRRLIWHAVALDWKSATSEADALATVTSRATGHTNWPDGAAGMTLYTPLATPRNKYEPSGSVDTERISSVPCMRLRFTSASAAPVALRSVPRTPGPV
jgi:hypothetical protein